ncbi:DUF1475 family protein [Novipirellula sp. SH528]|uniref:DUF1475 family protein n=1 Tax=Novipirellula sp. SH528 TaxID=3454466 RepID=UPI003FA061FB
MKLFLASLCVGVIICMAWITIAASLDRSVLNSGRELWNNLWFRATLMDAYFAFLTFFVWVAYKEQTVMARAGWFVAIMLLGNFAMSGYVLWKLLTMKDFSWQALLLRQESAV